MLLGLGRNSSRHIGLRVMAGRLGAVVVSGEAVNDALCGSITRRSPPASPAYYRYTATHGAVGYGGCDG